MPDRRDWTARYFRDREKVLGRRWSLSQDPELAAEQLAEHLGGIRRAMAWAEQLLEALRRRGG